MVCVVCLYGVLVMRLCGNRLRCLWCAFALCLCGVFVVCL